MTDQIIPLEHRIADAFAGEQSSATLQALLAEVRQAATDADAAKVEADRIALDPATRPDAVETARKASSDATFKAARFSKAITGIDELLSKARTREANERAAIEHDAAVEERDALAAELRREWPALAGKMVDLLTRLQRNTERCANLAGPERGSSAQAVAEGKKFPSSPGEGGLPLMVRVPAFLNAPSWPKPQGG